MAGWPDGAELVFAGTTFTAGFGAGADFAGLVFAELLAGAGADFAGITLMLEDEADAEAGFNVA